jgi:hypothetical protein
MERSTGDRLASEWAGFTGSPKSGRAFSRQSTQLSMRVKEPKHMQTFRLNNSDVRFFQREETIYLITSDTNQAFGFEGENTAFDNASELLGKVFSNETFIRDPHDLPDRTRLIELSKLVGVISRSNKPELLNTQDIFNQIVAKSFVQSFGISNDRKALPPISDTDRIGKLATAARSRYKIDQDDSPPIDKTNLPGWLTVTETLLELGEDPNEESSLINHDRFRFWINRQISDIYRAQHGEEPPIVSRKKGSGYCYPPSFSGLVELYRSNWLLTQL